jgi:hypothetical protein
MSREIMQQALDALKYHTEHTYPFHQTNVAIEALKQELAKPEQEPVALQSIEQYAMQMAAICTAAIGYWKESDNIHPDCDSPALRDVAKLYAKYAELYTAPPRKEWVGLTDEDCIEAQKNSWNEYKNGKELKFDGFKLCKNIEQILKEKNT